MRFKHRAADFPQTESHLFIYQAFFKIILLKTLEQLFITILLCLMPILVDDNHHIEQDFDQFA